MWLMSGLICEEVKGKKKDNHTSHNRLRSQHHETEPAG
eukprot:COSAG06_NODE_50375_length_319_cov_0.704545_2_plen_37_part_01